MSERGAEAPGDSDRHAPRRGVIGAVVERFLDGPLAVLLVAAAVLLGLAAVLVTPREEEPQIVVPMADVHVAVPGASAEEVEKLVATPLERLLWQIDGVEDVYSTSERDRAVVTVRFFVGEDREDSLVKLHNRVASHVDEVPAAVAGWVVKPIEIDDVPIVTLTLASEALDDHALRRVGEEVRARIDTVEDVSRTRLVGGRQLVVSVEPDRERMIARGVAPLALERALAAADVARTVGAFDRADARREVRVGPSLLDVTDVEALVVGVHAGRPVHLRDVARVALGPEEAETHTRIGVPAAEPGGRDRLLPAVTLAVAKKRGTNAVTVAERVIARAEELRRKILPDEVELFVTRDYGRTADDKVDELLSSLAFAMVTVVGLLVFTLGWREGLVVALAVPLSFALALFVNLVAGYTINRVTLFALILTLGLVVDDPITNVDNIDRHVRRRTGSAKDATRAAVQEVLPPVIMSTLTVIVSFLPLFFITGMMGPYMEPMAITVPVTVTFSTLAAVTVVPWAAHRLLAKRPARPEAEAVAPWLRRGYARVVGPFLDSRRRAGLLFLCVALLLLGCGGLVLLGHVPLKMLPFDDKNELQLVVDLPEGSTLERTDAVVREFERYLFTVPEVVDFESYVGTYSPIDFNGLVRHAYFRLAPHLADVRVNLVHKDDREQQSHPIGLRLRDDLERIAERHGARLGIVESPPGPPVLATVVAEVYGAPELAWADLVAASGTVMEAMRAEPGLADVDRWVAEPHERVDFVLDREKAGLHGIDATTVARTLAIALGGAEPARVHRPGERQELVVRLRLPRAERSGAAELGRVAVQAADGHLVALHELGRFTTRPAETPIHHKNLERVVYVVAETAGRSPVDCVLALQGHFAEHPLPAGVRIDWAGEGEWDITLRVFRDLGLAFGAALVGIWVLLVIQTGSFAMPLLIMTAIPLTAIGILPGFAVLNLIVDRPVGGYATPVFFTATAMIGMIALGGIVVRNSIVLIEWIQNATAEGTPLRAAILESGAIRMRPILLTAATTALGAWPITLDPIFSGLAWALIFGLVASTAFTLVLVPVTYGLLFGRSAPG